MTESRIWAALWITWLVIFCVIEFTALLTGKPQFTLSEYVWRLEGLGAAWTFVRYFIAAFGLWLFLHLTFGLFR